MAVRLTHVGGPTVLIEAGGARILTDPTFDRPGRTYGFALGTTSTKTGTPALDADDLGPLDAILLTHDHHADNLDDAGRALLARAPVVVTTEPGASRLGGAAVGLAPWTSTTIRPAAGGELTVTATPCRHGPPLSRPLVGAVVGFAIEGAALAGAIWVTGDTVLTRKVRAVADRLEVDVAIVHAGAVRFPISGPLKYTMDADDVVELVALVRPHVAVPVHYEGWTHFSEDPGAALAHFAADPFTVLTPGVATEV